MKSNFKSLPHAHKPDFKPARSNGFGSSKRLKSAFNQSANEEFRLRYLMSLVSESTGILVEDLTKPTRNFARAARARQICMYLAYTSFQWPLARIGKAFGRDRTTVGYACRLVEDLRDDREFDRQIEEIEACMRPAVKNLRLTLLAPNLSEMPKTCL